MKTALQSWLGWVLKIITGGLIAWFLIWLFLNKGCGHPAPTPAVKQDTHVADSQLAVIRSLQLSNELLEADTLNLKYDIFVANQQLSVWQAKVAASNKQATGLANDVMNARTANDTAKYEKGCDSLAAVTLRKQHDNDSLKRVTRSALDARDDMAKNRAIVLSQLQAQAQGYQSAVAALQKQIKDNTPTGIKIQVYGGLEGFTSIGVSGIGIGGALIDKKQRMYQLGGGIATQGGRWIRGGYYRLIHF